jgi:hypothetical protein
VPSQSLRTTVAIFAFVGSAVFVVLIWRQLAHIRHADGEVPEPRLG